MSKGDISAIATVYTHPNRNMDDFP